MSEIVESVRLLTLTTQRLLDNLYRRNSSDETFEQNGIINGQDIIEGYLKNNEIGLAVEHLLYMVHESNITLSTTETNTLNDVLLKLGIDNVYVE